MPKSSDAVTCDWDFLLGELQRSTEARPVDWSGIHLDAGSFAEQQAFVHDRSPLIGAICTRRAAKSYSGGLKAYDFGMLRHEGSAILIAGLNQEEVRRIWWDPILKDIADRHGIPIRAVKSEMCIYLPNRSRILLLGMDANEKQKRNALGQKYSLILLDEAQDWTTDLNTFVYGVLKPCVADYNGSICLLGTPGLIAKGLFYDVVTGREKGWSVHEWDTYKNTTRNTPGEPTMAERWDIEIKQLQAMKPGIEETPWFQRNYLKKWVIDEDAKVYRYTALRNTYRELPAYAKGEWTYGLGCDLGHVDATSFTVSAYHEHDPCLYVVRSYKMPGLDFTDVAQHVQSLDRTYSFAHFIVDGANKQGVEEMRKRHGIPWEAADKTGKASFIDLMNADFITGCIKLHETDGAPLAKEYDALVWDEKKLRLHHVREEDPRCENHCADGGLYIWRKSYPYLSSRLPAPGPAKGSVEFAIAEKARLEAQAEAEYERELEDARQRKQERDMGEREMDFLYG